MLPLLSLLPSQFRTGEESVKGHQSLLLGQSMLEYIVDRMPDVPVLIILSCLEYHPSLSGHGTVDEHHVKRMWSCLRLHDLDQGTSIPHCFLSARGSLALYPPPPPPSPRARVCLQCTGLPSNMPSILTLQIISAGKYHMIFINSILVFSQLSSDQLKLTLRISK